MLDLTPKEIIEKRHITINPCKTCEPVGAMYAALGVESCMPHSHGSQGCCSYHRTVLSRHFKEPVMATSSSFTEGASVFGGRSNLNASVRNIFDIYDPDIIAVHTTCLSETIGDDVGNYIMDMDIPEGKTVLWASTPSYEGSHIQGFSNMLCGIMEYMTEASEEKTDKVAIIPGWVEPGDDRELKRLANMMGVEYLYFPDHSNIVDAPMTGKYVYFPKSAGTPAIDIKTLSSAKKTIALGQIASYEPAEHLDKKHKVPFSLLPMPVGVELTDKYIMALREASEQEVPKELEYERGRLVDLMLDSQAYTYQKTAGIYGDPDVVYGFTSLCIEMGMIPKYVITGTPKKEFVKQINKLFEDHGMDPSESVIKADTDLFHLHQLIKNESVDILIGGSYGKQIAKAEDIPLVRMGFPVLDRYGNSIQPTVGYTGGIRFVEKITNALMDRVDEYAEDEDFELVM